MNIGESLSFLKKEKGRLVRLINLRKENVFVEKGKTNSFDPKKLTVQIDTKLESIKRLKLAIQRTNLETNLIGENKSLAEAIIEVGDIRSKISELSKLFERRSSWLYEKEQKETIALIDESIIEDEIEKLESEKAKLDNKIQMTNWAAKIM